MMHFAKYNLQIQYEKCNLLLQSSKYNLQSDKCKLKMLSAYWVLEKGIGKIQFANVRGGRNHMVIQIVNYTTQPTHD